AGFWHALFEMGEWTLWAIQLLTLLGVFLLGLRGARSSGNLQLLIALAILGLTLLIWFKGEVSWRDAARPLPTTDEWPAMATALAVMFWCFVGLEAFAHMGEEFKRPERDYPIALLGGVLLAGLIYWVHSLVVLKYGLYGDEAKNATAIPSLLALLFGPTAKWLVAVLGYLSCFASINIYIQGFARLIWSMAREGKLPPSLAVLTARGAPLRALTLVLAICLLCITLIIWLRLPLDELIRYANGNFVLVYLLCMAAGWRLLGGVGKGLAGISVLLCALVLVALATQVLYAVVLSLGYGGFSLWRRHLRRSRQQDVLPVAK
ncbi:MAG: L-methionine/branched-chain amino acid transporter, partial [Aeromonas veronii]